MDIAVDGIIPEFRQLAVGFLLRDDLREIGFLLILPFREALRDDKEFSFTVIQDAPLQPFPRLESLDQPLGLPEVSRREDLPRGEFHALGDGLCLALDLVDEPLLDGARLEKTEDGEDDGDDDQDRQTEQQDPFHFGLFLFQFRIFDGGGIQ